jgi:hypothetical protein
MSNQKDEEIVLSPMTLLIKHGSDRVFIGWRGTTKRAKIVAALVAVLDTIGFGEIQEIEEGEISTMDYMSDEPMTITPIKRNGS